MPQIHQEKSYRPPLNHWSSRWSRPRFPKRLETKSNGLKLQALENLEQPPEAERSKERRQKVRVSLYVHSADRERQRCQEVSFL